jgi:haloacetate dehalogenase
MWHELAARLARDFTVVATDLRGYGDSSNPPTTYLRCVHDPQTIHGMCEDYRAGTTYDRVLDEADRAAGRRIACPVLALWSARDELPRWFDVVEVWRQWAAPRAGS